MTFISGPRKIPLTKKFKAKLKRIKFLKGLSKKKWLKRMTLKKKKKKKISEMPQYSYLLNDVGPKSNDQESKILLGQFHSIYGNPEDPRDFDPYKN